MWSWPTSGVGGPSTPRSPTCRPAAECERSSGSSTESSWRSNGARPLAAVVRAQAEDARTEERRRLMELAGRKDVAMLIPVVFLVLPTVVLVALFPGVQSLRLVVP